MKKRPLPVSKFPLVLRFHRLMDVFTKADDERDFYLDKVEGFLLYADLDKSTEELVELQKELEENKERYLSIPKMSFYEIKKLMEGFVHDKVYDIDVKEKLLDIIGSKDPRENFLEFIYDHLTELEKWQVYYQEKSRIRVIEWLRSLQIQFVFEEDLELPKVVVEKVKRTLFESKVAKDLQEAKEIMVAKSKVYYLNEALHPRPKRGRPPKQVAKVEIDPQISADIYTQVPSVCRPFLYIPDITSAASVTFSSKFETEEHLLVSLRGSPRLKVDEKLESLSERLESLRHLSQRLSSADKFFGGEKGRKPFDPLFRPKLKEVTAESKGGDAKYDSAIGKVLPKRGMEKEAAPGAPEEFTAQSRRRFAVKKVAQISAKKKPKRKR